MNIFDQIKSINLPLGEYAVIGGGVLSAHGIRPHKDIDLVVSHDLYTSLKNQGWETKQIKPGFEVAQFGIFEASPDMVTLPNYNPNIPELNIPELIKKAVVINGVAFVGLREVIDFKRALGREKDVQDIKLIEEFLKTHHS